MWVYIYKYIYIYTYYQDDYIILIEYGISNIFPFNLCDDSSEKPYCLLQDYCIL